MKKDKSVGNILEFPEKIFIGDITGQRVCVKIYGPESLENQLAVVTHYLHNQNTHAEDTYKEDGIPEIKHLVQYFFPDLVNPDQMHGSMVCSGMSLIYPIRFRKIPGLLL